MEIGGAYTTERAAALSGVPKSTAYYWARKGLLLPSVSQNPLLWSYTDLLALRTIYWLRQPKVAFDRDVPATSMPKVRRALQQLKTLDLEPLEEGRAAIAVTMTGEIVINSDAMPLQRVDGQYLARDLVNIVGPFEGLEGARGPDLLWPRPTVQILPGKISGAPHIAGTRLPTQAISALADRGFSVDQLVKIYPFVSRDALAESLDLEAQLKRNAALKRAA
jgi:uncharacterized protein (DUF433 family)/DNA-binding transcriptional MerR regulator